MNQAQETVPQAAVYSDDNLNPLDLLSEVSKDWCDVILSDYQSTDYAQPLPEWDRLRRVQKVLMRAGRHVPSNVDQVVDLARGLGGLKR